MTPHLKHASNDLKSPPIKKGLVTDPHFSYLLKILTILLHKEAILTLVDVICFFHPRMINMIAFQDNQGVVTYIKCSNTISFLRFKTL